LGLARSPRRVLWDKRSLPSAYVSEKLGISRRELGTAIHVIKLHQGMRGDDHVIIYEDGDVTDEIGNLIGNIYDEC
jgi:hypothetical protein